MSESLPPEPTENEVYVSTSPHGSAPVLVRTVAITAFVLCGLDALAFLLQVFLGITLLMNVLPPDMYEQMSSLSAKPLPQPIAGVMTLFMAVLAAAGAIVMFVSAWKLIRRRAGAWGWGLAGGIVGCAHLWCGLMCVLPLAAGVFIIIAMSQGSVRRYLASSKPLPPTPSA